MIQSVIFDMDGLLIDSEPLWQRAEIEILGKLGLNITVEDCKPVQGMKLTEVVEYWYARKPWSGKSLEQVRTEITDYMKYLISTEGKFMPGVKNTLDFFAKKNIPMAVASSSDMDLINLVLDKLGIREYFAVVHSSEYEKKGKPEPDIFITTAKLLDVPASGCLVFEDSVNGVIAAKKAGMIAVAVPYPENYNLQAFDIADLKLHSLEQWNEDKFDYVSGLVSVE